MRLGLQLEIAITGVPAVIAVKRELDVDRVGIVPLDQIAVVAVHRPHEAGERTEQAVGQAATETRRSWQPVQRQGRSVMVGALNHCRRAAAPSGRRFRLVP